MNSHGRVCLGKVHQNEDAQLYNYIVMREASMQAQSARGGSVISAAGRAALLSQWAAVAGSCASGLVAGVGVLPCGGEVSQVVVV